MNKVLMVFMVFMVFMISEGQSFKWLLSQTGGRAVRLQVLKQITSGSFAALDVARFFWTKSES